MKHYLNVCDVNGAEVEPVDVVTFGSPCFTGEALVLTSEGIKRIDEIKVNDMVFTRNEWKKVTETMKRTTDEIFCVKAVGMLELNVTGNHPLWIRHRGKNRTFSDPEWIHVKDIKKGDYLCMPQISAKGNDATAEELWLLGRYVADGYIKDSQRSGRPEGQLNHTVVFCIGKNKIEDFKSHLREYNACIKKEDSIFRCEINSTRLMNLCKSCGKGALNKEVPCWVLEGLPEEIECFLDGYMSGDGCFIEKIGIHQATTISRKLAITLQMAVHKAYGLPCKIYLCKRPKTHVIEGRKVNQHDTYTIRWASGNRKQNHCKNIDGEMWMPVTSCKAKKEICEVFNLEVEDIHSYTANGIVAHNCQDLSVAGLRKGLKHESNGDDETTRSGLFMEAVRIIKEMRKKDGSEILRMRRSDVTIRPRFAIWENVPGAFSSNNGEDFRVVLEELARIKEAEVSIPMPEKGKWKQSGEIVGDGWSIAWRTLDAQYHGVPQRRRRIFLVADFADECAGKILFECEGLPGYSAQGAEAWEGTSDNSSDCIGRTGERSCLGFDSYNQQCYEEVAQTLKSSEGGDSTAKVVQPVFDDSKAIGFDCYNQQSTGDVSKSITSAATDADHVPCVAEPIPYTMQIRSGCEGGGKGPLIQTDKSACLTAAQTQTLFQPVCIQGSMIGRKDENGPQGDGINEDVSFTLNTIDRHAVAYGISSYESNSMKSSNPHSGIYEAETSRTLDLNGGNPACNQGGICICEPISIENHPNDSRIGIREDGTVQALTGRMGTGGGNVPLVGEPWTYQKVSGPLMASGYEKLGTQEAMNDMFVTEPKPMNWDGGQISPTLTANNAGGCQRMPDKDNFNCVLEPKSIAMTTGEYMQPVEDCASTLLSRDYKDPQIVCYALDRSSFNQGENAKFDFQINDDGIAQTLVAKGPGAVCHADCANCEHHHEMYQDVVGTLNACDYKWPQNEQVDEKKFIVERFPCKYIVRRLTPTECARLQGMPDEWCRLSQIEDMSDEDFDFWTQAHKVYSDINGKTYRPKNKQQMIAWYNKLQADASEYKAYGNGMALPCVRVPVHGVAKEGAKTMASLFDGIGGFPLAGLIDGITTLWTSEIELFPIAVTIERFREYEQFGGFTFGTHRNGTIPAIGLSDTKKEEKEKKEMELKINEIQLPEAITFNYDELKRELTNRVSMYETLVYTEESIKDAKNDRASLNKLKKALNDERIRLEKEYMVPFNEFKAKINEIIGIIDKPCAIIDKQVKEFEDKQKQDKLDAIVDFFNSTEHPEWLHIAQIMDDKWTNASTSMKAVHEAILSRLEQIKKDIETLSGLPEFGFEASKVYETSLDMNRAVSEAQRMSQIAKEKAEREAAAKAKAEEEARLAAEVKEAPIPVEEEFINKPVEKAEPKREWIKFQALLTVDQARELKKFFDDRSIEFKAI